MPSLSAVMPALVAGIHVLRPCNIKDVDGRDIGVRKHAVLWTAMPGHDEVRNPALSNSVMPSQDVTWRDEPGHDTSRVYRGGIRIRSSSCAWVNSVGVNFRATASFTIVSSPVILSGSTEARGKKSSRVRLALASVILSQSE